MTNQQIVKARWPNAEAYQWGGNSGWIIYTGEFVNVALTVGATTARQAWADATKHSTVAGTKLARKHLATSTRRSQA